MDTRLCLDAVPFALPVQETRTFPMVELSSSEKITELFVALEQDDWDSVFQIVYANPNGITNYTGKYRRGYTMLHYAVDRDDRKQAEDLIQELLNIAKKDLVKPGQLYNFVNTVNEEDKIAMDIAVCRQQYLVIDLLLDHGAEMKFRQFRKVIKKIRYRRLFDVYDKSIHVHRHNYYYEHSLYWIVYCQFPSITWDKGEFDSPNDKYREMMYPSALLTMSNESRGEILMHPLFQIFLWEKWRRLSFIIWMSIIIHMIWYALSTTYIVCNTCIDSTGFTDSDFCQTFLAHDFDGEPNLSASLITLVVVYLVMLLKELYEFYNAPECSYYWSQLENIGQWFLLIILPVTTFLPTTSSDYTGIVNIGLSLIVTAGIVTSLFLVQGQFTKIELLGVYNQMMRRSFKKLLIFLTANVPLLVAFVLIFRLMLPNNKEFELGAGLGISKLFAMMIGEIDLGEIIHKNDQLRYEQLFAVNILIIIFILIAVVVLHNMLIAITIDDLETLKRKATEEHLSAILETLCILENVLMNNWMLKIYDCLHIKNWVVTKLVLTDYPQELAGEQCQISKIRFVELPKRIQVHLRNYMKENPQCIITASDHQDKEESLNIITRIIANIKNIFSRTNKNRPSS